MTNTNSNAQMTVVHVHNKNTSLLGGCLVIFLLFMTMVGGCIGCMATIEPPDLNEPATYDQEEDPTTFSPTEPVGR